MADNEHKSGNLKWAAGDPITATKMERIEDAIDVALGYGTQLSQISTLRNQIGTKSDPDTIAFWAWQGYQGVSQYSQDLQAISDKADEGHDAKAAIDAVIAARNVTDLTAAFSALDSRLDGLDTLTGDEDLNSLGYRIAQIKGEIETARGTVVKNGREVEADSLAEKINYMSQKIRDAAQAAADLDQTIKPTDGLPWNTRLLNLDGKQDLTLPQYGMNVPDIITEIKTARNGAASLNARFSTDEGRINALDSTSESAPGRVKVVEDEIAAAHEGTNDTLKKRFEADETRIGDLETYKLDKRTDVVADLATNLNDKALAASQGRKLMRIIGSYDETNTVEVGIGNALQAAKDYADDEKVAKSSIYNALDKTASGFVLDARQGKALDDKKVNKTDIVDDLQQTTAGKVLDAHQGNVLANEISAVNTRLGNRITDVESELTTAHTSSVKKETVNDVEQNKEYGSLDERLEAIETDIDTIATELNMYDVAENIQDAHTRIDTIEKNVVEMGKEIGMIQDQASIQTLSENVERTNTYMDQVRQEINDAHRTGLVDANEDPITDTLDHRFDDVESDIGSVASEVQGARGGFNTLALKIADMDSDIDDLETDVGQLNTDIYTEETGLMDRMTAAEEHLQSVPSVSDLQDLQQTVASHTTAIDDLEDDVDSINTTLGEHDQRIANNASSIQTVGGTVAAHTSALENLSGRMDGAEEDIGDLQDDLNTANTGLKARMIAAENDIDALEAELDTANTGLKARMTAAEDDIDTLESTVGTLQTTVGGINTAMASKSATIVVPKAQMNYDADNKPTTFKSGATISNVDDYLIQSPEDDKYYYWKYINNAWVLISGGGASSSGGNGGGTGNNNAVIYMSEQEFNTATANDKDENTDYYVLEEDVGYHHYRFIYDETDELWTKIEIGAATNIDKNHIKKYNIIKRSTTKKDENDEDVPVNYLDLYEYDYGVTNEDNFNPNETGVRLITSVELPIGGGGGTTESAMDVRRITPYSVTAVQKTTDVVPLQFFFTTGDVSGSGFYNLTVTHDNKTTSLIEREEILSGDPANASYSWPTKEVEVDGETQVVPMEPDDPNLPVGFYQIDIGPYCTETGVDYIYTLSVFNSEDTTQRKTPAWSVRVINLSVTSLYSDNTILNLNERTTFTYIPVGNIDKTAHIKFDGVEIGTRDLTRTDQNKEFTYDLPTQSTAGVHSVEMYLSARVSGKDVYSNHIFKDIIWRDPTSDTIFISSPYRDRPDRVELQQYKTITIPYTLAGNVNNNYTVQYYVDSFDNLVNEETFVNNNIGSWTYRVSEAGNHDLIIKCGSTYITIEVTVEPLNIDISPVISNLAIDFNPIGMNNNSTNREWSNSNYHLTVSDNFDWYNGGYGSDTEGSYFLVKAGTRAYFDYKMFKSYQHAVGENTYETRSTVFRDGAEMKIIFKTAAVRDASAVWFSNMGKTSESSAAKEVGIQLNVHNGWLKTDSASNTEVNGVAATNTYLYFPYSEEDKIELDISINKQADAATKGLFLMSYEDGCPSKAYPYTVTEALYHTTNNESIITIGSDDCDVYIYRFKIYTAALDTEDVLRNFIADGKDVEESISRYDRNSIYWDTQNASYTPYEGEDTILDPERLAVKMPDVKILMLDTPRFTTSKKDFVAYSSLRCIHATGGKVYPSRGKADNWLLQDGYHAGQGTTSDKYGNAGRNVDFLFECDGVHNPSDKVKDEKFIPNYQSSLILGYGTDDVDDPKYCLDWKDEDTWKPNTAYGLLYTMSNGETHDMMVRYNNKVYKCLEAHTSGETFDESKWEELEGYTSKVSLTATSIPNNFFNLKVNIASSENVNNALLQKRYNDYLTYLSPAYLRDRRIKNDMEFVPALLFVRENDDEHTTEMIEGLEVVNYTNHKEFNDKNWHFYALGNIGDSKKTDYTRAYDPTDINEFTLEISDNNTNNSQFQSGVYYSTIYYDRVANPVITDIGKYYEASETPTLVEGESNRYTGTFVLTTDTEIASGKTYYAQARMIEAYHAEQDKEDDGTLLDTFTAKSDAGESVQTMAYAFPITMEEWAGLDENDEPKNMRYWSLYNEELDGDHSFEMRYAYYGNYRDGKLVNGNKTESKAVLKRNSGVWRAFYTWLVTATDEEFVTQLDEWVVRRSVAFFYAFTHYYTMMDNRAKNTFWHFAKTGKHRKVLHPMKEMIHTYDENPSGDAVQDAQDADIWNGTFVRTADTDLDAEKQYYTEYAFDMWVYDCDTAIGIDNNGELVFPYGKEDTDYRIDGDASSSYVFNGAGSIFWRRLSKSFNSDIVSAFTGADEKCFNAEHLIQEFDKVQSCYPEAIWRLDVERKYIRSFTGDYGYTKANPNQKVFLTRQETRFLRDMMQGRKKYQRRQWCKDQDVYFGSKYLLPNVFADLFEFSCYNPGGMAVTPNWDLTITPYQDMYINISYAETFARPFRAKAGVTYEFQSILNDMNDSRIRIYGANHIQALAGKAIRDAETGEIIGAEGLASFYMKANNFQHTHKLRKLIIGTDNTAYENGNFTTLNITDDNPILEVLDIQNCNNLGGQLNLSNSTSIQRIEAQGTQITSVNLPPNTGVQVLHLPETINNITLYSAKSLRELTLKERDGTVNTSSLSTLLVSDSDYSAVNGNPPTVNWMALAAGALTHLSSLQLIGLRDAYIGDISDLEPFAVRKGQLGTTTNEAGDEIYRVWLTGYVNVNGAWSQIEKENYSGNEDAEWPDLTLNTIALNERTKWKITYKYPDGVYDGAKIYTMYVDDGSDLIDIRYGRNPIWPDPITRPSIPQYSFEFGSLGGDGNYARFSGWKRANASETLLDERNRLGYNPRANNHVTLEAVFTETPRKYQVRWFLRKDDQGRPITNSLVATSRAVNYGEGYDLEAPTVYDIRMGVDGGDPQETTNITFGTNNRVTYSIFNGWEKLPVNLQPDGSSDYYDIFANWITGTNENIDTLMTPLTYSPVQLLILSRLDSAARAQYLSINDQITLNMGCDSVVEGELLIGEGAQHTMIDALGETDTYSIARFDNSSSTEPMESSIRPLAEGHDEFTLAIDYRFDNDLNLLTLDESVGKYPNAAQEAVLVGCYEERNNATYGFKLFYDLSDRENPIPRFGFGDTMETGGLNAHSVMLGDMASSGRRNMIVVRHPAGSEYLYIYSGVYNDDPEMPRYFVTDVSSNAMIQTLEWNNVNTNAPLTFGHLKLGLRIDEIVSAKGTVYWAKYWNKDLGAGECKRLATWTHEKMTFVLQEFDGMTGNRTAFTSGVTPPSMTFSAITSSQYSPFWTKGPETRVLNTKYGWETSDIREIANKRIFCGMPMAIQAVTAKSPIKSKNATWIKQENSMSSQYIIGGTAVQTNDFVFFPGMIELGGTDDSDRNYSTEASGVQNWVSSGGVTIKEYNSNNQTWSTPTRADSQMLMNLRFPGIAMKARNNKIYIYNGTTSAYTIINRSFTLERGDILIVKDGNNTEQAYIYVLSADILAGAPNVANTDVFACTTGRWVKAERWWTRSMFNNNSTLGTFMFIQDNGGLQTIPIADSTTKVGYNFSFSFSV